MKNLLVPGLFAICALPLIGGPPCTNTSVAVTFQFSYVDPQTGAATRSSIYSDGTILNNPAYTDGLQGVSATINCNTGDLVLDLSRSTRSVGFDFTSVLESSPATPEWVPNAIKDPFYDKAHITVRNLLYGYSQFADYAVTTRLGSQLQGPDGKTYQLRMVNPGSQAYTAAPEQGANSPLTTSLVQVRHTANPESWVIYADSNSMGVAQDSSTATQVSSLLFSSKNTTTNVGQFRTPFFVVVTRK